MPSNDLKNRLDRPIRPMIGSRWLAFACLCITGCQTGSPVSVSSIPVFNQAAPTLESAPEGKTLKDSDPLAGETEAKGDPVETVAEQGSNVRSDSAQPSFEPTPEAREISVDATNTPTIETQVPQPAIEWPLGEHLTEGDRASSADHQEPPSPSLVIELPWSRGFPKGLEGTNQLPSNAWPLSVDEAIRLALENTTVLRSLGAQILRNPEGTPTAFDPWITSSDPRSGTDAALADFDTNLNGRINYANNDDVFNNAVLGGGANEIQQDLVNSSLSWQKFTSSGAQYSLTGAIDYDDNTRPSNLFPSVYNTRLEAQVRQPLLQGRGDLFNSIAGPSSRVDRQGGTGILIAQANVDMSVVQFERDVTAFVNDIISAYWNLYLAYQNVEIARTTFEQAEKTWKVAQSKRATGLSGGEAYREAQAREQRDRFEVELLEAIHNTGETGAVGLLQAEARLRLLLKLPSEEQILLYPVDDPVASATVFDADSLKVSANSKRVEVREQNIRVERDQMQLIAANNFLLPRLDAVAVYRNNGFGDTLALGDSPGFESATDVAADGLYDEWEIGLQYNMTLGARRARAGIKNSRLRLKRSQQLLEEIRHRIRFDIDTALRSAARSELTFAASERLIQAAKESYESHQAAFQSDLTTIDELLRAQQRLADAQRTFNRQLIDRTLAVESVFRETGSLLEMHGVKSESSACDINLLGRMTACQ